MLPVDPDWPPPEVRPTLVDDEFHLWRVDLARTPDELAHFVDFLSADERARAARFLHIPSRNQFVTTRTALRLILADYLTCDPTDLNFTFGPHGKPTLLDPPQPPLFFNVTHSHELALIAVGRRGEVGVDVEHLRDVKDDLALAERFFAPPEVAVLVSLPLPERRVAFFNAWTRKEAFLKAVGKGISYGVERVEVTLRPEDPPRVLHLDGDAAAAARWSLWCATPAPGYLAALAAEGTTPHVVRWTWPDLPR